MRFGQIGMPLNYQSPDPNDDGPKSRIAMIVLGCILLTFLLLAGTCAIFWR